MARLIIVAGASGAGKSFLLEQVNRFQAEVKPIKKYTTRPNRQTEPKDEALDLIFGCNDNQIRQCDYKYYYCDHNYGINKADIDEVILNNLSPMVIVANCQTIDRMKKDYPNALVLYVQTILSGSDLKEQLIKQRDPIDVEERMKRQESGLMDYIKHFDKKIFNYVLINDFSHSFLTQIQYILDKEIKEGPDSNYVFVIMSFNQEYNDIYEAFRFSGNSINHNGLIIQRIDEHIGGYVITEKIDICIERAGLIICDVSEMSPNIFYELGYARGKYKSIIMTARKGTTLPFDIRQYRTVFYDNAIQLQKQIIVELKNHFRIQNKNGDTYSEIN